MNAKEPTYFLYSGRLFHEAALPALRARQDQGPQPRHEDPGPEGPEGEPVGDDEDEKRGDDEPLPVSTPSPAPDQPSEPREHAERECGSSAAR